MEANRKKLGALLKKGMIWCVLLVGIRVCIYDNQSVASGEQNSNIIYVEPSDEIVTIEDINMWEHDLYEEYYDFPNER